jgi:hypothetical protein
MKRQVDIGRFHGFCWCGRPLEERSTGRVMLLQPDAIYMIPAGVLSDFAPHELVSGNHLLDALDSIFRIALCLLLESIFE